MVIHIIKKKKEVETKINLKFIILKFIKILNKIEPKLTEQWEEKNIDNLYQFVKKENMTYFLQKKKLKKQKTEEEVEEEFEEEFNNFVKLMRETILICGNYLDSPDYKKNKKQWHKLIDERIWQELSSQSE